MLQCAIICSGNYSPARQSQEATIPVCVGASILTYQEMCCSNLHRTATERFLHCSSEVSCETLQLTLCTAGLFAFARFGFPSDGPPAPCCRGPDSSNLCTCCIRRCMNIHPGPIKYCLKKTGPVQPWFSETQHCRLDQQDQQKQEAGLVW